MNTYLKLKKRGVVAAAMNSIVTREGFQAVAPHQLLVSAADGMKPANRPPEMGAKQGSLYSAMSQPPGRPFAGFKAEIPYRVKPMVQAVSFRPETNTQAGDADTYSLRRANLRRK